jgi:hypothetical protein
MASKKSKSKSKGKGKKKSSKGQKKSSKCKSKGSSKSSSKSKGKKKAGCRKGATKVSVGKSQALRSRNTSRGRKGSKLPSYKWSKEDQSYYHCQMPKAGGGTGFGGRFFPPAAAAPSLASIAPSAPLPAASGANFGMWAY